MSEKDWKNFDKALFEAWLFAINSIGMEEFKKASFFGSNLKNGPEILYEEILFESDTESGKIPADISAA